MNRRYFTTMIVFFAVSSLFGLERADDIPGIDPVDMASGDATGISDSDNRVDPSEDGLPDNENTERPAGDSGYPRIRNLTVRPDPRFPNSAKISWEVHPDLATPVYIVRYSRPISTRELLLESYNLTPEPIGPEQTTFIDKAIPRGTYYYALVSTHELSPDGELKLIAGQNYTGVPFIVGSADSGSGESCNADVDREKAFSAGEFQVRDLSAINTENGVVLNWKRSPVPGIRYHIYRGPDPLDSPERLAKANRLGEVREESPFFEDTAPQEGNQLYYGVSVYDCVNQKEYPLLTLNESYISHAYRAPTRRLQYDNFLPGSFMAYLQSKDTIRLLWVDPGPAVKDYEVYRGSEPIQDMTSLSNAQQIGTVENGANGFTDTNLKPGQYFYALIPRTTSGKKILELQAGRTFTAFGVGIRGATDDVDDPDLFEQDAKDGRIYNLSAEVNGDAVVFEWKFKSGLEEEDVQLFLYRSREPIPDIKSIERTGVFLAEIPVSARRYLDRTGGEKYYYAFVENYPAKKKSNIYHTPKPLGPAAEESESTDSTQELPEAERQLREILGRTYALQRYQDCVDELRNYLQRKDLPEEVRARALFYQGQSYYFTGQYEQARDIFKRKDIINQYNERALFWYRRTLERTE